MEYKTKEQIWQEQENNPSLSFSESALIAMEEYGTQEALYFATWISNHRLDFQPASGGKFIGLDMNTYTPADLYQEFKKDIEKKVNE